jgi:glycosyltransferase involved in cell wall biosynthesis
MAERRMMLVSVVVPTRNRSRLLRTALRSVLRQRAADLEVIVVDEASTDDTTDVIAALGDRRLRVIRNDVPLGPNGARNRGAAEARGEWLAFVDDDDLWAPDKILRQIGAAEQSGRDWVYAGSVNVNDRLEVVHGVPPLAPEEVAAALPHYNAIPASASNVVIRREAFVGLAGFNEDLRACEEWELWLRLADRGLPAWVRSPLVAYRMHARSASLDVGAVLQGARALEQLHGAQIDWGRFHWWVAQLCLRNGLRGDALRAYGRAALAGRHREVGADLANAVRQMLHRRVGLAAPARRADAAWEAEAQRWLEEFRNLHDPMDSVR